MKQFNSSMYNANTMYQMCLRKNRYKTYDKAVKAAKYLGDKYHTQYRVYYCNICNYYHLTTQL